MIEGFEIYELVPEHVYKQRGEKAWQLFDKNALLVLERLREEFGPCIVNDWFWGGNYSQSGLRTHEFYMQQGYGEVEALKKLSLSHSQHKYGRGFDVKFKGHTAEEVRQWIKENWGDVSRDEELFTSITLEEGVSWLHFDVRPQEHFEQVYTFYP